MKYTRIWWRITAWGELASILASTLLAPLLLALTDQEALRLLGIALASTAAAVATSLAGPQEPRAALRAFYDRVRPPGFWGPIAREAGRDAEGALGAMEGDGGPPPTSSARAAPALTIMTTATVATIRPNISYSSFFLLPWKIAALPASRFRSTERAAIDTPTRGVNPRTRSFANCAGQTVSGMSRLRASTPHPS